MVKMSLSILYYSEEKKLQFSKLSFSLESALKYCVSQKANATFVQMDNQLFQHYLLHFVKQFPTKLEPEDTEWKILYT